jgi:quinol monooxygenase YgiN
MHVVTLRIKVPPKRRKDFIDAIHSYVGPCRVQPECTHCSFYHEFDQSDKVMLMQEWGSKDALDKHLRSKEFRIILSLMDLSSTVPEFQFHTISRTEGFEAVETLRLEALES